VSLANLNTALQLKTHELGRGDLTVAGTLENLGIVHGRMGEFRLAVKRTREALEIFASVVGEDGPDCRVLSTRVENLEREVQRGV
jgi:hypothetical protein